MYSVSAAFNRAVQTSHSVTHRLEIINEGDRMPLLDWDSAAVEFQAEANIRASLKFTLPDPTGAYLPRSKPDDLMSPFGTEIIAWRGVRLGDKVEEVPLGIFAVMSNTPTETGRGYTLAIECLDRSARLNRKMARALSIVNGTPITDAVKQLAQAVYPGADFQMPDADERTPTLFYDIGTNALEAVNQIAAAAGYNFYADRSGLFTLDKVPKKDSPQTWVFEEGANATIVGDISRTIGDSVQIPNGFIVVGSSVGGDTAGIKAEAWDEDASSATYRYGRYGENAELVSSEKVQTLAQAQQVADVLLQRALGRTDEVSLSTIPHPGIDVDDVVALYRESLKMTGLYYITQISLPLSTDASSMTLRRLYGAPTPTYSTLRSLSGLYDPVVAADDDNLPPPVVTPTLTVGATVDHLNVTVVIGGAASTPAVSIDWGDGTTNTSLTHTYASAGTFTIHASQPSRVTGTKTVTTTAVPPPDPFAGMTVAYYGYDGANYRLNRRQDETGNIVIGFYAAGKTPLTSEPPSGNFAYATLGLTLNDLRALGATKAGVSEPFTMAPTPFTSWTANGDAAGAAWLYIAAPTQTWDADPQLRLTLYDNTNTVVHAFAPVAITQPVVTPTYDALFPLTDTYTGTYGSETVAVGVRFHRTGTANLTVAGVRWWRSTTPQDFGPSVHFCKADTGTSVANKAGTAGAPGTAGWETVMFDTPQTITDNADYVVWVVLPNGGYAATGSYFDIARTSPGGLIQAPGTAGRFSQPPPSETAEPVSAYANGSYWVTPVVQ